jgi:class 3 adenylate cyclase
MPEGELQTAAEALNRGDLLKAQDLASAAPALGPDSLDLQYIRILALARMGSSRAALEQYRASDLSASGAVEHRVLLGRLLKDMAAKAPAPARPAAFAAAAEVYRAVYEESGDPFPGINAASLALLAGDREAAERTARQLLQSEAVARPADYFTAATKAEALLIIGDMRAAGAALRSGLALNGSDEGARSSTLRQLRLLLGTLSCTNGDAAALVDLLRPSPVVTYCGHMFRHDRGSEAALADAIDEALDKSGSKVGYGSLACGSDIMVAEAILRRGGEINVVLPFDDKSFIERSILPGGDAWLARFEHCRDNASSLTYASVSEYVRDRGQFRFGLLLAMGLARLRAAPLGAEAVQLAIWDGKNPDADAGTSAEVRHWRNCGGRTVIIEPGAIDRNCGQRRASTEDLPQRALRAIVFADFAGFSKLRESVLPAFSREVLGRVASVLARYEESICARNTWGDGVFVILRSATAAAALAAELQGALQFVDPALMSAEGSGMRISAHFGPVYEAQDPVTGSTTFFGREVTCAARIEPVTPIGGVYVTQPLAAMLAMEAPDRFDLCYVGRLDLAKGYGNMPLYGLERNAPAD